MLQPSRQGNWQKFITYPHVVEVLNYFINLIYVSKMINGAYINGHKSHTAIILPIKDLAIFDKFVMEGKSVFNI